MPRVNAKGKWDLNVDPDEFYRKPDPFSIILDRNEEGKMGLICGLIENYYGAIEGNGILDIGCGEGHSTPPNSWGIDISTIAIGRARMFYPQRKSRFYVHDITKGTFEPPWECIILSEVLYYIKPGLWPSVVDNIYESLEVNGQFIISVGQYFTEDDIREIFKDKIMFDKVYKLPNKKYGYWLIMSGHRV